MKKFFLILSAVFILIQLFRPSKNISTEPSKIGIVTLVEMPDTISAILKRSCFDCHSNQTNYKWYHNIAPFSWGVANHIKEAKKHVNFDHWGKYNENQKDHIIEELIETIETREMPLVGYLAFHPEAVISDKDNSLLLAWLHDLGKKKKQ